MNLTWGRLYSRLREMAPEPHPTSRHVSWASPFTCFICRSVSTSSTNSCTNVERKHCSVITGVSMYYVCLCGLFFSNLCFRSWYEHRRSHLQCQISEVPLLNHILHRHSTTSTLITKSKKKHLSACLYESGYTQAMLIRVWVYPGYVYTSLGIPRLCLYGG